MRAGVYCIENKITRMVYIGQSRNMESRMRNHKAQLASGGHPNIHLQSAYNLYGKANFVFRVLEVIDEIELLNEAENRWIQHYGSFAGMNGFNIQFPTSVFRGYILDARKEVAAKKKRIKTKKQIRKYELKECRFCGKSFRPARQWHSFCSSGHRAQYHYQNRPAPVSIAELAEEMRSLRETMRRLQAAIGGNNQRGAK